MIKNPILKLKIERESKQLSTQYLEAIQKTGDGITPSVATGMTNGSTVTTTNNEIGSNGEMSKEAIATFNRVIELQNALERQSKELAESRHRLGEYQTKFKDFEEKYSLNDEKISNLNKELISTVDFNKKLQREIKDALMQKEENEQRLANLEQRYINLQRECSSLTDLNNRLETELAIRDNSLKHVSVRYFFLYHFIKININKILKNFKMSP